MLSCPRHTIIDFLRSYQMDPLDVDFKANVALFDDEMVNGLAGKGSSLEMIPTFLSPANKVPANTPVIVADAGGTNFRVATICFNENSEATIEHLRKSTMPGVDKELGRSDFFEAMAVYFKDVASASDRIGFCFSYLAEMQPNKDGRLIRFSKEIKAEDAIGAMVGENLTEKIVSLGLGSKKEIVILNDTVATLLAGIGHQNKSYSSYVGFILGTGTNTCYIEKNMNITKQGYLDSNGSMLINVESGGMDKVHRGQLDRAFDESTKNPGAQQLEKMISGAYLGPLILFTVKTAAADGLFSEPTANAVQNISELETRNVNDFMGYPYGDNLLAAACGNNSTDVRSLYTIADRLVERAAKLTAVNLSAAAIKTEQGTDPTLPICIVAEGTTFYHMKSLKTRTEYYLKKYLEDEYGVYTEIISVENATLIGAAIAGLTN